MKKGSWQDRLIPPRTLPGLDALRRRVLRSEEENKPTVYSLIRRGPAPESTPEWKEKQAACTSAGIATDYPVLFLDL